MLALALAVCMAVPAFASNEDSNFMIPIASNYTWGANEVSVRKKDNSTSAYVNYNIPTSPNRIVVRIDGASGSAGPWYDCTSVDLWYLNISARCGGNLWAEGLCPSGCV